MPPAARIPELGARGEGWVVLQIVLVAAIVGSGFVGVGWPGSVASVLRVLGTIVGLAGACLFAAGLVSLGSSLTPMPRPHDRAVLRQGGALRLARHPIYGGAIVLALGWSLAEAPVGLALTVLLAAFFTLKSKREELWLLERYPDYAGYRARTPRRFVPWLY